MNPAPVSPSASEDDTAFVRLRGIGKSFSGAKVLSEVDVDFRAGEVHAIIGENGAGKSTVGKIVGGYYAADEGSIEIDGAKAGRFSPRQALASGIAMIHQELQLVPQLSVAKNVFLGIENNLLGATRGDETARLRKLDERCGFGLDPDALVSTLRIADRQKVEIMRAIARDARLIIMDEPASSLTADEVERLHRIIAWLRDDGRCVVYVTHQLDHVLALCDRVTIMRDGRRVRTSAVSSETRASLVEGMIGSATDIVIPHRPPRPSPELPPVLDAKGLTTGTGLRDVSIAVRPGRDRRPDRPRRLRAVGTCARHLRCGPITGGAHCSRGAELSEPIAGGVDPARHRLRAGGPAQAGARPDAADASQSIARASAPGQPARHPEPRRGICAGAPA
jgi:ribose transport system ATP-binding protein